MAWGSHVYFESVRAFKMRRFEGRGASGAAHGIPSDELPVTLTKFGLPDWRQAGMDPQEAAESPAQCAALGLKPTRLGLSESNSLCQ